MIEENKGDLSALSCANCMHFERLKFHKSICENETPQKGGNCKMLKEVLGMTNSNLWAEESLHVQETFGCRLHE